MTRVLFLVILVVLVLGLIGAALADLPPGGTFTDDDGNIHESNIEAIAAEGITKGCNPPLNNLYCPSSSVTRGQMAAFLVRALNLTDDGGGNTFIDDDGSIFENDIAKLATAAITKGCNPPTNNMFCPNDPVSRDQMASFLARALGLSPIVPPPPTSTTITVPPAATFTGPLQSEPGLSGEISFDTAAGGHEVMNPTIKVVLDRYTCDGVILSGDGQSTVFTTVPVVNESFAYYGPTLTWTGTFNSSTQITGTVAGTTLLGTVCDWGPLSWSATAANTPPPATSTTSTSPTSTTSTTAGPGPAWPPCDFSSFSISGTGPSVPALQVPGDRPAILDISYSGTGGFWVDSLDVSHDFINFLAFDTGGGYHGVRLVNESWIFENVRYLDVVEAAGAWTVEVRPVCSARSMTANSISGTGDDVILVNQDGSATITHSGSGNLAVWSHQAYDEMDLEVNVIGPYSGQIEIDSGTVFLGIEAEDTDGMWTVSFP